MPACGSAVLPHSQNVGEGTQESTNVDSARSASFRRRQTVRSEQRSRVMGTSGKVMQDSVESDFVLFSVFVCCTRNLSSPPRDGIPCILQWKPESYPLDQQGRPCFYRNLRESLPIS